MPSPRQPTILGGLLIAAGMGGLLGIAYGVGPGAPETPKPSAAQTEAQRPSVRVPVYQSTYDPDEDFENEKMRSVAAVEEEDAEPVEEVTPEDAESGTTELEPEPIVYEEVAVEEPPVEEPMAEAEPEPEPEPPAPVVYPPPPFLYIPPTYIARTDIGQTSIGPTQIGQTIVSGPQVPRAVAPVPAPYPMPMPNGWTYTTPADVPTGTRAVPPPVPPGVSPLPAAVAAPPGVPPPNVPPIPPGVPPPPR